MTHEIHEHWSPTNNDDSTVFNKKILIRIKVAHYIREKFLKTARYDLIMKDTMIYNNYTWEKGGKYEIWVQKTWFSKISSTKYEQKSLADSNSGLAVYQTDALPTELWS